MSRKKLLPCLALFCGPAEPLQRQGPSQASFFGQRTIGAGIEVAREESERLGGVLAPIEQEPPEQHPGRSFLAAAGELLLELAVELHR